MKIFEKKISCKLYEKTENNQKYESIKNFRYIDIKDI